MNKLRKVLELDLSQTLYFKSHQGSVEDSSTMKNAEGFKFVS